MQILYAYSRPGWTVRAGSEYAFLNNLIGRVEYRYSDFGTFSYAPAIFAPFVENHRITENQVLVGLSYKFGFGPLAAEILIDRRGLVAKN